MVSSEEEVAASAVALYCSACLEVSAVGATASADGLLVLAAISDVEATALSMG